MKRASIVLLILFVLLALASVALAMEMSGEVTAVDAGKGTISLKTGTLVSGYDCETGSLLKDVKVGDKVTVDYKEEMGKKVVTKISPLKQKPSMGY
jgi:hypothetical protein